MHPMNPQFDSKTMRRRDFLAASAMAGAALALNSIARSAESPAKRRPIIGFSKPFQAMEPTRMADFVSAIGWDGIECPVREKGQIEPEQAVDKLPAIAEIFRKHRQDIFIVATDITSLRQKHAEDVLRAISKTGIKRLRLGFFKYDPTRSPQQYLEELRPVIKDIADACHDLDLQAGIENHSGSNLVGAPVWDVYSLIKDIDPRRFGMCFDIGHATIEGGLSWPIQARLMEPFYTAVYVKDFVWKKESGRWREDWVPLGSGMVNREFIEQLKSSSFDGPICQHHEYELGNETEMAEHMRRDLNVLRSWLA